MAAFYTLLYLFLFCEIFGIGLFLKGFFPLKENTTGFSTSNSNENLVRHKFDRLIVVLVDALRADFVFENNSYMAFTSNLIKNGDTFSFRAYSSPPTVTMPRIKAITTGTVPGFIDVIMNIDSNELSEDNLIAQTKQSNKKVIFYGDNTWIKLFPNHFKRHDGTTSFFVSDYTEVDENVTRHVIPELNKKDWDVMILHYLGLDHIGHLAGPNSPLVRPKLREMDEIIHRIYETIMQQDFKRNISTLLVLCGDHGMSDGGSHGGSSFAETTTPLVFMSSLFALGKGNVYDATKWVDQIDITPTLALLLGLSIPKNSFGILIPDLFNYHSVRERLEAIRMNALQISTVYMRNTNNESVVELDLALRFHDELIKKFVDKNLERDAAVEKIEKLYFSGMKKMAEKLTKFMSSYDFYSLYVAISLLLLCFIGSIFLHLELYPKILYEFFQTHFSFLSIAFFVFTTLISYSHFYLCTSPRLGTSEILCSSSTLSYSLSWTFITITVMASLSFLSIVINIYHHGVPTWHRESLYIQKGTCTFLLLGILLHNISLLSTSFIEEEHQTWYFLTTTYHSIVFFKICSERWKMNYQFCSPDNVKRPTNDTSSSESTDKIVLRNNMSNLKVCDHTSTANITALYVFILLICDRTLRSWNQTGIKWSEEPDIEDWLINPERNIVLSLLIIISLVGITLILFDKTRIKDDPYEFIAFVSEIISVYIFRATTGTISFPIVVESRKTGKNIARFIYCCVIVMLLRRVFAKTRAVNIGESIICAYVLLITLLLRTHNIPTVLIMLLQARIHHQVVWSRCFTNLEVILSAYYMGWLTYFAQGNSNSLATVDISAGYIGLGEDYWPLTVALLTTLATFSGPLFGYFKR